MAEPRKKRARRESGYYLSLLNRKPPAKRDQLGEWDGAGSQEQETPTEQMKARTTRKKTERRRESTAAGKRSWESMGHVPSTDLATADAQSFEATTGDTPSDHTVAAPKMVSSGVDTASQEDAADGEDSSVTLDGKYSASNESKETNLSILLLNAAADKKSVRMRNLQSSDSSQRRATHLGTGISLHTTTDKHSVAPTDLQSLASSERRPASGSTGISFCTATDKHSVAPTDLQSLASSERRPASGSTGISFRTATDKHSVVRTDLQSSVSSKERDSCQSTGTSNLILSLGKNSSMVGGSPFSASGGREQTGASVSAPSEHSSVVTDSQSLGLGGRKETGLSSTPTRTTFNKDSSMMADLELSASCGLCGMVCPDGESVKTHMAVTHACTGDVCRCDVCSLVFPDKRTLLAHLRGQHEAEGLTCKICSKSFACQRYLRTHLQRHAGLKKFECPQCGWRFFERHKLNFHLELHKVESERRLPYRCDLCKKQFANKASWSDHCNTHSGHRPFQCDVCGATFGHRVGLRRHKVTHDKVKPFACHLCSRTFAVRPKLEEHMTTHTGVSRHTCLHCSKVFTAATSLKRHSLRCTAGTRPRTGLDSNFNSAHTTGTAKTSSTAETTVEKEMGIVETIFMCGDCNLGFTTYQQAMQHVQTHSGSHLSVQDAHAAKRDDAVYQPAVQHGQTHSGNQLFVADGGTGIPDSLTNDNATYIQSGKQVQVHSGTRIFHDARENNVATYQRAVSTHSGSHLCGEDPESPLVDQETVTRYHPTVQSFATHSGTHLSLEDSGTGEQAVCEDNLPETFPVRVSPNLCETVDVDTSETVDVASCLGEVSGSSVTQPTATSENTRAQTGRPVSLNRSECGTIAVSQNSRGQVLHGNTCPGSSEASLANSAPSGLANSAPSGLANSAPSGLANSAPSGLANSAPSGLQVSQGSVAPDCVCGSTGAQVDLVEVCRSSSEVYAASSLQTPAEDTFQNHVKDSSPNRAAERYGADVGGDSKAFLAGSLQPRPGNGSLNDVRDTSQNSAAECYSVDISEHSSRASLAGSLQPCPDNAWQNPVKNISQNSAAECYSVIVSEDSIKASLAGSRQPCADNAWQNDVEDKSQDDDSGVWDKTTDGQTVISSTQTDSPIGDSASSSGVLQGSQVKVTRVLQHSDQGDATERGKPGRGTAVSVEELEEIQRAANTLADLSAM